ncbi:MAG: GNAT family N-acetyltransferase [Brachybacterium sp.]|uniref:GNAT family N-acetyltransferase n=1 Tax=unclassified Brachybacterium TaxID=2623841 RepID=UPI003F8EEB2C
MNALSIRPLTEELVEAMSVAKPGWGSAAPAWLESMRAGRSTLLVAVDGEDPVGVAQLVHDEIPEACNVGVLESHRGRGIGAALMREAEQLAEPAGRLRLGVGTDNPDARRLYERLGYRGLGELVTTTYDYMDDEGVRRTATETDEWMEKDLS